MFTRVKNNYVNLIFIILFEDGTKKGYVFYISGLFELYTVEPMKMW